MKIIKLFKNVACTFLVASIVVSALAMTGCAEKPDKQKEINRALNAVTDFLANAKDRGNYSSVSVYSDGSIYRYYTDSGKIKIEYKETTTYGIIEDGYIYKIAQADDLTWHKNNSVYDLSDPEERVANLITNLNRAPWNDYDNKTKTLKWTQNDESATVNFDGKEFIFAIVTEKGTTTHIIKDVGTTTVVLPEDIIDDTQQTDAE